MRSAVVTIPERLATTAVAWEGAQAEAWLERLAGLVAEVAVGWDLDVGEPFHPGGNISWVAPVTRRDGSVAVLKLQLPHPESAPEAVALQAWDGNGAVRLLDHDPARCALLIERCRPGSALVERGGAPEAVRAGAALGARLHAVAPPSELPTLSSVLDPWADELDDRLAQRSWPDPALGELAVELMRTRSRDGAQDTLLHGDLNPTNVLAAEREPWLAIDPKPMVGDPAYDGARLVLQPPPARSGDPAATLRERLDLVAGEMGIDRSRLVEWCLVNAVELGASARSHGDLADVVACETHAVLLGAHLP